ncbi:MAG: VWA domain-containing protein [Pseudomonadota bacterium]
MSLPRALDPFLKLPAALRDFGFAIAPDQTMGFVEAVGLLGPRSVDDIRRAAGALFAIPPEQREEFDGIFDAIFLGKSLEAVPSAPDDSVDAVEPQPGTQDAVEMADPDESGQEATTSEVLHSRSFAPRDPERALRDFARRASGRLPRRISRAERPARTGRRPDLRRSLREAVRRDGEIVVLRMNERRTRPRRIVLLIDISGSMRAQTDMSLRFAHALVQAGERVEVFTLGTRLTRVTSALRLRNRDQAMARASAAVADIDGGTRLGEALEAYLSVPRYAGFARGAAVVVLSDGLDRGAPETMERAVARLARRAWRLDWLTPLMADAGYAPRTAALRAALPHIDTLAPGQDIAALCDHVLNMGGRR